MKELRSFIVGMILLALLLQVMTGHGVVVVTVVVALLAALAGHLRTVMIAIALPVLFAGGLLWVSPWHRDLAGRLIVGALVVLVVAVLGQSFLDWFQAQLAGWGHSLFRGQP